MAKARNAKGQTKSNVHHLSPRQGSTSPTAQVRPTTEVLIKCVCGNSYRFSFGEPRTGWLKQSCSACQRPILCAAGPRLVNAIVEILVVGNDEMAFAARQKASQAATPPPAQPTPEVELKEPDPKPPAPGT